MEKVWVFFEDTNIVLIVRLSKHKSAMIMITKSKVNANVIELEQVL